MDVLYVPVSLPNPMASDEEGGAESTAAAEGINWCSRCDGQFVGKTL